MVSARICLFALLLSSAAPAQAGGPEPDLAALVEQGRWPEAVNRARRHVEMNTDDPAAWLDLGRVLFLEGRLEQLNEAVECLTTAVDLDPSSAEGWYWLGRAQGQAAGSGGLLGRLRAARRTKEAFVRSCELSPDNFRYTYALIQFHLQAPALAGGDPQRAEELASGFTDELPGEKALLEASVALARGDTGRVGVLLKGVDDFDDPLVSETWSTIALQSGDLLLRGKDWEDAVLFFEWVTARLQTEAAAFLGLGRALEGAGRPERAREVYLETLAWVPEGPVADSIRRRLNDLVE